MGRIYDRAGLTRRPMPEPSRPVTSGVRSAALPRPEPPARQVEVFSFYIDPAIRDAMEAGIANSGLLPAEWLREAILAKLAADGDLAEAPLVIAEGGR